MLVASFYLLLWGCFAAFNFSIMTGRRGNSTLPVNKRGGVSKGKGKATASATEPAPKASDNFPGTSYMIFLEQFKKKFKEEHDDKFTVSDVTADAKIKWDSMTGSEKAPYIAEAKELSVRISNKNKVSQAEDLIPLKIEDDE